MKGYSECPCTVGGQHHAQIKVHNWRVPYHYTWARDSWQSFKYPHIWSSSILPLLLEELKCVLSSKSTQNLGIYTPFLRLF